MISVIGHNIISPLGDTSLENYLAVKQGCTALKKYNNHWNLKEPFTASLFESNKCFAIKNMTRFESMAIESIKKATENTSIDLKDSSTILILSTTKGNIELLADNFINPDKREYPAAAAQNIADYFNMATTPIVVCNACISGVAALTLASRLLNMGYYKNAVVCGADTQCKFIVSGFQSFKALSVEQCMPFDKDRVGLNLGEAAATIVLSSKINSLWRLKAAAIRNDANHISGPSRTGQGSYLALKSVLRDVDFNSLSFVNVHGTATLYNDQMESIALERAGLCNVPINGLKGYYGHTMGAAGVLETIISMCAVDDSLILKTKGFSNKGVDGNIRIVSENTPSDKKSFVKLLSGFGGCNAAVLMSKEEEAQKTATADTAGQQAEQAKITADAASQQAEQAKITADAASQQAEQAKSEFAGGCEIKCNFTKTKRVQITPCKVVVNGNELDSNKQGKDLLVDIYHSRIGGYPKFFKMDTLSKLGFVAGELLLSEFKEVEDAAGAEVNAAGAGKSAEFKGIEDGVGTAVVFFNSSSSILSDKLHQRAIIGEEDYFPSPSVFVYTLPNITTGELAIKHKFYGETSFYVLNQKNWELIDKIINSTFEDNSIVRVIGGWLDCQSDDCFEADVFIAERI